MQDLFAVEEEVKDRVALPFYFDHKVVGCVRSGHPTDACLTVHVLMENLAGKASGVLARVSAARWPFCRTGACR